MTWPLQSQCNTFYGNPRGRNGQASKAWESANLVLITLAFPIYFLGKPARMRIHKKTSDAWMAWSEEVWKNSGKDKRVIRDWGMDNYGGSYNYRVMRGGHALSMHAYGIAADFDAPNNGQYDKTPRIAKYYDQIVAPFVKLGGVWGGSWDGDRDTFDERASDGMHFQWARLK